MHLVNCFAVKEQEKKKPINTWKVWGSASWSVEQIKQKRVKYSNTGGCNKKKASKHSLLVFLWSAHIVIKILTSKHLQATIHRRRWEHTHQHQRFIICGSGNVAITIFAKRIHVYTDGVKLDRYGQIFEKSWLDFIKTTKEQRRSTAQAWNTIQTWTFQKEEKPFRTVTHVCVGAVTAIYHLPP